MPQERNDYIHLLQKQIDGTITEEELIRLDYLSAQIPTSEQEALFEQVWKQKMEKDKPTTHPFTQTES